MCTVRDARIGSTSRTLPSRAALRPLGHRISRMSSTLHLRTRHPLIDNPISPNAFSTFLAVCPQPRSVSIPRETFCLLCAILVVDHRRSMSSCIYTGKLKDKKVLVIGGPAVSGNVLCQPRFKINISYRYWVLRRLSLSGVWCS